MHSDLTATDIYRRYFAAGARPEPDLTLSEWADENRMLPRESSAEPGRYRTDRTPYVREPQDHLSPSSPVQHTVIMKGTQLGLTTIGENLMLMVADKGLGPALVVFPTGDLVERFSKKRLAPAIKEMACLKGKIMDSRSRDSGNTMKDKSFPGGSLRLATSNSGPALRSDPVRFLILDDRDGYVPDVNGEGEPGDLAKNRTDTFASRKKIYENSTPTIKGESRIEMSFKLSSQAHFYMPCPHCGESFTMGRTNWKQMKYRLDEAGTVIPDSVFWECESCGKPIRDRHKTQMLLAGEWIHTYPDRPVRGYKLPSLYSPVGWVSWAQICQEYADAKSAMDRKDPSKMKKFINTRMAETWEEELDGAEASSLYDRREDYGPEIPSGGLVLTAGVDVQADRLECEIVAWGTGYENWGIEYHVLEGDPAQPEVWTELEKLMQRRFPHVSGARLPIPAVAVDSGYLTDTVYQFCAPRWPKFMAVKGMSTGSRSARPIVSHTPTTNNDYKCRLYSVGTDTAKEQWTKWFRIDAPGPGYCHFPAEYTPEFFGMLTAEKVAMRYLHGYAIRQWVKPPHARNEAFDIRVYSLAALKKLNPNFGAIKRKIEALQAEREGGTMLPDGAESPPKPKKKNRKRRQGISPW